MKPRSKQWILRLIKEAYSVRSSCFLCAERRTGRLEASQVHGEIECDIENGYYFCAVGIKAKYRSDKLSDRDHNERTRMSVFMREYLKVCCVLETPQCIERSISLPPLLTEDISSLQQRYGTDRLVGQFSEIIVATLEHFREFDIRIETFARFVHLFVFPPPHQDAEPAHSLPVGSCQKIGTPKY